MSIRRERTMRGLQSPQHPQSYDSKKARNALLRRRKMRSKLYTVLVKSNAGRSPGFALGGSATLTPPIPGSFAHQAYCAGRASISCALRMPARSLALAVLLVMSLTRGSAAQVGCVSIAPTSKTYAADQQNDSVQVTVVPCEGGWSVSSSASWITITSPTTEQRTSRRFSFTMQSNSGDPNATTPPRTGTVTVTDPSGSPNLTFTATQNGCSFSIGSNSVTVAETAGSYTVPVFTGSATACPWTASTSTPWITITTPRGSGDGMAGYPFAANPSSVSRSGNITVAGQTLKINQRPSCSYKISPASQVIGSQSAAGIITVTSPDGCTWTANSTADWIMINSHASGSGNGTISFVASVNTTGAARTGTITLADQTFRLTQSGSVDQADLSVAVVAGSNPVAAGTQLVYTLTIHNAGPNPATGIALTAATPGLTTFASLTGPGSTVTPGVGQSGPISVYIDSIPANQSVSFTLTVNVLGAPGSSLVENVSATSLTTDPVSGNNSASLVTEIRGGGLVELSWDQEPSTPANLTPPPTNLRAGPAARASTNELSPQNAFAPASDACALTGYHVYLSTSTPVETIPANLWLSLPPTNNTPAPVAPGGTFYVVTTLWNCGGTTIESGLTGSGGSNQTGVAAPPNITNVSARGKLRATGIGFSDAVEVFIDGVAFSKPAGVKNDNTLIVQKGPLVDGRALSEVLVPGKTVLISFRNSDGSIGVFSYVQE